MLRFRPILMTTMAALRVLENEARAENDAVQAAERSLAISTAQYKAGTASYLQVITAQTAALQGERSAVDILTRRLVRERSSHRSVEWRMGCVKAARGYQ